MAEIYSEAYIKEIANFDFYSGNKQTFQNKIVTKSVLRYGKFSEHVPLITIIIPTYKRVETLKWALYSALNQRGFDDYEVLVVDNEGEDLQKETDTEKFIKEINNPKVIYYRHEKSITFKMDHAVNLARTKWICILHDDDMLAADTLSIMLRVLEKEPKITWLASGLKTFKNSEQEHIISEISAEREMLRVKVAHYPDKYNCTGYTSNWLGALIDRDNYISMGGMPDVSLGCGDLIMMGKYAYEYGCYAINELPYYYRTWEGQVSSLGNSAWFNVYIGEFLYYRYCAKKFHKVTRKYWEYIGWQLIKDKIEDKNQGFYQLSLDENELREKVGVPKWWSKRGVIYKCSKLLLAVYWKIMNRKAGFSIDIGK